MAHQFAARSTGNPRPIPRPTWSYEGAFCRHRGLIDKDDQERLRSSHVAIAGLGGVGGIDLVTLARLGIGGFTLADPDTFDLSNTNRQYGAMASTVGRGKARVMADIVQDINPEIELRIFTRPIDRDNVDDFLDGAHLVVDAIDAFEVDARRLLTQRSAARGLYTVSGGPVGYSAVWQVFDPQGMSFDEYFDINDDMDAVDKMAAFIAGIAPKATHRDYLDVSTVDIEAHTGPSAGLTCHLAASAVACEAVKILLGKERIRTIPCYQQLDLYTGRFVRSRLRGGNRHPLQRIKRRLVAKVLRTRIHESTTAAPLSVAAGG